MAERNQVVLVDTTAIIEAHAVGCWEPLIKTFKIETVEKCVEECATGFHTHKKVRVDPEKLRTWILVHKVSQMEFVTATMKSRYMQTIDDGERELLAHAAGKPGAWIISSQDKGCIRAGWGLGMLERFVSLEELAEGAGRRVSFKDHFTRKWLSKFATELKLESLLQ